MAEHDHGHDHHGHSAAPLSPIPSSEESDISEVRSWKAVSAMLIFTDDQPPSCSIMITSTNCMARNRPPGDMT